MMKELTYVLITPYSLTKSRTGSIIGRLLTLSELELVGARMLSPSDEFVDRYVHTIDEMDMPADLKTAYVNYINENLRPGTTRAGSNRTVLLLLEGPNAVATLKKDAVGSAEPDPKGDTIRGAYGDIIRSADGEIRYFEPAVLTSTDRKTNLKQLRLISAHAAKDGGVLDKVVKFPPGEKVEITLVILKPDNFGRGSARPGNIIDMFSRTGLRIIGAKMLRMSVAQGIEFYGPLLEVFEKKLRGQVADRLREGLHDEFSFEIPEETYDQMADMLKKLNARFEFNRIVEYMTGINPDTLEPHADRNAPGKEKCLALLYQGMDAVSKIRERLGATDPTKAAPATVRSSFGQDLMKNAAHASDSVANALRERRIVGLLDDDECQVSAIINHYLAKVRT